MTGSTDPVPAPTRTARYTGAACRSLTTAAVVPLLVLGLSACAPEPGTVTGTPGATNSPGTSNPETVSPDPATSPEPPTASPDPSEEKPDNGSDGGSWSETNDPDDPSLKNAALPKTFPTRDFPIPSYVTIDDAGVRDQSSWFIVLRAADQKTANKAWSTVRKSGKFTVSDQSSGSDGEQSMTLTKPKLSADALMIPQSNGSVLLSYELSR
ncbi:MAG: hypothetical protein J0H64_09715 [Actinobacteria bacterium]|nr:hypothetical protein [Actinomycetota bacterium]